MAFLLKVGFFKNNLLNCKEHFTGMEARERACNILILTFYFKNQLLYGKF
jgi:hypothetical protein